MSPSPPPFFPPVSTAAKSELVINRGKKWSDFKEPLDMAEADELQCEACWTGFKQVGMKTKGGKQVPNCVPEEKLFEGEVSYVKFPGTDGEFGVLNNHAPIVSTLKNGLIRLKGSFEDNSENLEVHNSNEASLEIHSGVIEMKKNKLIILVD